MKLLFWIALAGAAGTLMRYAVGLWLQRGPDVGSLWGIPWGTLGVNIVGCFVLGLAFRYLEAEPARAQMRTVVAVGFCGGFTTFSAFGLETVRMIEAGKPARAALYVGGSVAFGLLAVVAGLTLAASLRR